MLTFTMVKYHSCILPHPFVVVSRDLKIVDMVELPNVRRIF